MITKQLRDWLEKRWRFDNHRKYHGYFQEWLQNITPGQIQGFSKQMYNDENNVLR